MLLSATSVSLQGRYLAKCPTNLSPSTVSVYSSLLKTLIFLAALNSIILYLYELDTFNGRRSGALSAGVRYPYLLFPAPEFGAERGFWWEFDQ
ncbi:hypothetical protein FRC02_007393 [Tulasnella sp. 418]|nr:hypothetical protein FRC02_007393 [Tulasnella sp. 418]